MQLFLLCIIVFSGLPMSQGISLFPYTSSTESQDNGEKDEGLSQDVHALPGNLEHPYEADPNVGDEEDPTLSQMVSTPNDQLIAPSQQDVTTQGAEDAGLEIQELLPNDGQPAIMGQNKSPAVEDKNELEKRSPKFNPNGEDYCLLSDGHGDFYYEITDQSGVTCKCELCRPGHIVQIDCTCDPSMLDIPQPTSCTLVDRGRQYMPVPNKCTTGLNCTICILPEVVKTVCGPDEDTECTCGDDGYMSDDGCRLIPRCNQDYEPAFGDGHQYNVMVCVPCKEGFHQPKSNSTDKCSRIPISTSTPTPQGITPQDIDTSSEEFFTPEVKSTSSGTQSAPCGNTTEFLPTTSGEPKSPEARHCLTWEVVVWISVVTFIVAVCCDRLYLYLKKCYHQRSEGAPDSKNSSSSYPLVNVTTLNGYSTNTAGGEGTTQDPPAVTAPLNPEPNGNSRQDGKKARGGKKGARKRGGKHNSL